MRTPTVTVGIPTRNRAAFLRRALASVLSQGLEPEIVVCDNASDDDTPSVCREFADASGRIRYFRQPVGVTAAENFVQALQLASGELFMWLADDDWLGDNYLETCVSSLMKDPNLVGVVGLARYYENGKLVKEGVRLDCTFPSPERRIIHYFGSVRDNAAFYGLYRMEAMRSIRLRHTFGGDWFVVAALLARGQITTLEEVSLGRSIGGESADFAALLAGYGWSGWRARHPWLFLALSIFLEIGTREATYRELGTMRRLVLAWRAARALCRYRHISLLRELRGELRARERLRRMFAAHH